MSRERQKGTGYEREVLRALQVVRPDARRTQAGSQFDIESQGAEWLREIPIKALATRPDHGRSLVTISMLDFLDLLKKTERPALVECKRFKRFAHHTLFEEETA